MKKISNLCTVILFLATICLSLICCEQEVVIDNTPPSEVTNFSIERDIGNEELYLLMWDCPSDQDLAGFQLIMNPASGTTLSNITYLPKYAHSLYVGGLEIGTEYTITIKAYDKNSNYSEGITKTITIEERTSDTTPPRDVLIYDTEAKNGKALLNWEIYPSNDLAGIHISMEPAEGTLKNPVILEPHITSFDVSGLENNKKYIFTIKTFDTSSNFSEGITKTITVRDTSDKEPPRDVLGLKASIPSLNNLFLEWLNPSDDDFAGIHISMDPAEGSLKNPIILGKEATDLEITGLQLNKRYTITIKTFDTNLNYSNGNTIQKTVTDPTEKIPPENVQDLTITNKDASVLITWTDAPDDDIFGYEVTWDQKTPINRSVVMKENSLLVAPGSGGCYISNLTNGQNYYFTVKSIDINGNKSSGVSKEITPYKIQKNPINITLVPDITEITNKYVTISINIETDSPKDINGIAYIEGFVPNVEEVFAKGTRETGRSFSVNKNATYTVAVTDKNGRRELAYITIDNIDYNPPMLYSFSSTYSEDTKTILVSWPNLIKEDYDYMLINYGKVDEEPTTLHPDKNTTSIEINNIEADNSEYLIELTVVDFAGNKSTRSNTVITYKNFAITDIKVDRLHLDSKMENRDIPITITGKNFSLINDLSLRISKNSGSYSDIIKTILDKENNIATATITVPMEEGKYFINTIKDGIESDTISFSVIVTEPASASKVSFEEIDISLNQTNTIRATVTGENFDIRGDTKIEIFNTSNKEVVNTIEIPLENNISDTQFEVDLPVPQEKGSYRVNVYINDIKYEEKDKFFRIYTTPEITDITIPIDVIGENSENFPLTVKGINLESPEFNIDDIKIEGWSCVEPIIDRDDKITLNLVAPFSAGTLNVNVYYKDFHETITLKIVEAEKCYDLGDILLKDGTVIKAENISSLTESQKNQAAAVVGYAPYGGAKGFFLGLYRSPSFLQWTTTETIEFPEIMASYDYMKQLFGLDFMEGDFDGSDNWDYICSIDPEGTENAEINYPIFYFAETYGEFSGLTNTPYEKGWYIPSMKELEDLNNNILVLEPYLQAVGSPITSGKTEYWSSSQNSTSPDKYYYEDMYAPNKNPNCVSKDENNIYALVIRSLLAE